MEKICPQNCFNCSSQDLVSFILTKRSFRQMMLGKDYKSPINNNFKPKTENLMVLDSSCSYNANTMNKEARYVITSDKAYYKNKGTYTNNHNYMINTDNSFCFSSNLNNQLSTHSADLKLSNSHLVGLSNKMHSTDVVPNNFKSYTNYTENYKNTNSINNCNVLLKSNNNKAVNIIDNKRDDINVTNNYSNMNNNYNDYSRMNGIYINSSNLKINQSNINDLSNSNTKSNSSNKYNRKEMDELEALSLSIKLVGCSIKIKKLGINREEYVFSSVDKVPFMVSEKDMVTEYNRQKNSQLMSLMFK